MENTKLKEKAHGKSEPYGEYNFCSEVIEKLKPLLLRQFPREILNYLLTKLNDLETMKNGKIASAERRFKRKINYVIDNIEGVTNPNECLNKMNKAHANHIALVTREYVSIQLSLISVDAILFLNRIMKACFNAKNSQENLDHCEFFIISKNVSLKRATRPYNLMLDYFVMKMNEEGYQPTFKWTIKDDTGCLFIKCQMTIDEIVKLSPLFEISYKSNFVNQPALHRAICNLMRFPNNQNESYFNLRCLLKRSDVNINLQDADGDTIFHLACRYYNNHMNTSKNLLKLLLKHSDMNVNIQNNNGNTALHDVCKNYIEEVFMMLLKHPKIDFNLQNKDGETASEIACKYNDEIVSTRINELLSQY